MGEDNELSKALSAIDDYFSTPQEEINHLRLENERLQLIAEGKLKESAQAYLKEAGAMPDGTFKFDIQATIVPLIAEHLAETFEQLGGDNNLSIAFEHDRLGPFELIIQRRFKDTIAAQNSRLRKENAELRKALEPFAKAADGYDLPSMDNSPLQDLVAADDLTIGDLRRAAAALFPNARDHDDVRSDTQ